MERFKDWNDLIQIWKRSVNDLTTEYGYGRKQYAAVILNVQSNDFDRDRAVIRNKVEWCNRNILRLATRQRRVEEASE